jgi:uncharacterized membrane protein
VNFLFDIVWDFVGEVVIEGIWRGSRRIWREMTGKEPISEQPLRKRTGRRRRHD